MASSDKVVLVIEDIETNMKLFQHLLKLHGYDVLQATDGIEGWQLARKHRPNLIIMDIQLPDISGLTVVRLLKDDETLSSIPIIAVTAFALEGNQEKMLKNGCDAYISKPISVPKFLQTVEAFVAEQELRCTESQLKTA